MVRGFLQRFQCARSNAPVKKFNVVAIDYPQMDFNPNVPEAIEVDFERKIEVKNPDAKIYVLEEDMTRVAGEQPMPLTLRVNVGDCMKVKLTNKMKKSRASFSAMGMAFDPKDSLGVNLGNNPGDQTVAPGASRTYTYYADPFNGEMQMVVWDFGNVAMNVRNGLFGGVIIGPEGSQYRDPKTGADISLKNSWVADVIVDRTIPGQENRANYRDAALYFQDEDNIMGTAFHALCAECGRPHRGELSDGTLPVPRRSRVFAGSDVPTLHRWIILKIQSPQPSWPIREIRFGSMSLVPRVNRMVCSPSKTMNGRLSRLWMALT